MHEHPTGVTNWDLEEIKEMERKAGVNLYTADLIFAKQATKFITTSSEMTWTYKTDVMEITDIKNWSKAQSNG